MKINSVKPGVPKKATYLSLIAVVLFLAWLNYAVGYNHMPVKNTIWALTPPIMAISLALITKEVYSSLFLGMLTGALLNADFNPVGGLNQLFPNGILTVLTDKWNVGILVFLVILGTMVQLMIISISACMAGAVCGDHCSPISDTTIMSSAGAQCEHLNHVTTQLPYALTAASVSFFTFLVAGFTKSALLSLMIGIVALFLLLLFIRHRRGK